MTSRVLTLPARRAAAGLFKKQRCVTAAHPECLLLCAYIHVRICARGSITRQIMSANVYFQRLPA